MCVYLHLSLHTVDSTPSQNMSFHWPSFPMYDSTQFDVPSPSLGSPRRNMLKQRVPVHGFRRLGFTGNIIKVVTEVAHVNDIVW